LTLVTWWWIGADLISEGVIEKVCADTEDSDGKLWLDGTWERSFEVGAILGPNDNGFEVLGVIVGIFEGEIVGCKIGSEVLSAIEWGFEGEIVGFMLSAEVVDVSLPDTIVGGFEGRLLGVMLGILEGSVVIEGTTDGRWVGMKDEMNVVFFTWEEFNFILSFFFSFLPSLPLAFAFFWA